LAFFFVIDTLCINQEDIDERNSQVQMMASIFSSAKMVLSWLGDGSPSIPYGLLLIERIAKELPEGEQES
jgi:hypothetical protein